MPASAHALLPTVLPPMTLECPPARRSGGPAFLPQVARVSYVCVALALPSLALALTQGTPRQDTLRTEPGRLVTLPPVGRSVAPDEPMGRILETQPRYRLSSLRAQ